MPIDSHIKSGDGTGNIAKVNAQGALITSSGQFDTSSKVSLVATTVYNLKEPRAGQQFVITGIILNASRSVTSEALISIFESSVYQGASVLAILSIDVAKNTTISLIGLNLAVTEGEWLSCSTDDATCNVTVLGHYITI